MNAPLPPEKIRELLGGYATGTLTPEERAALMRAALEDQTLFDELMDEEALREALADRPFRAELLEALELRPRWWRTPWPWAAMATATAAVSLFVLLRPQPAQQIAAVPQAPKLSAALVKPEPVPSEISTPRSLRIHEAAAHLAEAPMMAAERKTEELNTAAIRSMDRQDAAAPKAEVELQTLPAMPAAAPPATGQFAAVADAMKEGREKGRADAGFEIATREPDGSWKTAQPGDALPAGRALRLRFTSPVSGTLRLEPPLAAPLAVQAGVAAEWVLPAQSRGELILRISMAAQEPPSPAPARVRAAKARAETAASVADPALVGGAAANRPASFPREIRLRIE